MILVFTVLAAALVLFILDRWRYDVVALLALLVLAVSGTIPGEEAFAGFGHPAVITVAAVLVISRALGNSGVVDAISQKLSGVSSTPTLQVAALTGVVTMLSGFMNDVGALALLMPVGLRLAARNKLPPSVLLMPLAFGSLLGGLLTLIGTPPNIIISSFRAETGAPPFSFFDYTPVGLGLAIAGVAFITLVGWRLLPRREGQASPEEMFRIAEYTTELVVPEGSPAADKRLEEIEGESEADFVVVFIDRRGLRIVAPSANEVLEEGDSLVVEVDPESLPKLLQTTGLELVAETGPPIEAGEMSVFEAVVMGRRRLAGTTANEIDLRAAYGLSLLAVARHGERIHKRLKNIRLQPGDVLLLQSQRKDYGEALRSLGLLPLAPRELRLFQPQRILLAVGIFGAAIAALVLEILPHQVAFTSAAVAMVLARLVSLRGAYQAIEWPIIVLLGAMIPVGGALESSGGAAFIASQLGAVSRVVPIAISLGLVMIVTQLLSAVMNNAATAVIMAPIVIGVARDLGVSADPFLMAVAVAASCAFLTPIGHQSATLVMGPGGYRFGDYWKMGLPLATLVVVLGVPLILWAWPP